VSNHVTIGVYANDTFKTNIVRPEHLEDHIEYNKLWRFGRALFVDGKCVYPGYLDESKVKEWEEKIGQMTFDRSRASNQYW
jgi:hypothetical protein